jgi:site-specific DNA-methyltransferase (adenine-specific)
MNVTTMGNGVWVEGECLQAMAGIPDGSIDMVLCDLPYGTTQNKWDSVLPLDELWKHYWRVCKANAAVVLTATQPFSSALVQSELRHFAYEWVWQKSRVTGVLNAKRQPLRQHESVLVFYKRPPTYNAQDTTPVARRTSTGKRASGESSSNYGAISSTIDGKYEQSVTGWPRSILPIASEGSTIHPTQKPVALFEYLIRTYTDEGGTVLDNTAGSGTTAIAAENARRRWICIEKDPAYSVKALKRIQQRLDNP